MKDTMESLQPFLNSWGTLPIGMFLTVENTRAKHTLLLKIRNFRETFLCEAIEPIRGITLRDIIGPKDYFLGELVSIDKTKFGITHSLRVLLLEPKIGINIPRVKFIEVIRDDGFLKVYATKNRRLLLTTT
jgi:hypothetical protein